MILRLRSRDGLERIRVDDHATVDALKAVIHTQLNIPVEQMWLSKDPQLLTQKDPSPYQDMSSGRASLASLGLRHGDLVYLRYNFERDVEPAYKKTVFDTRPFGVHLTVAGVMAKQVRIERQDAGKISSVSFDRNAANVFQSYVAGATAFSIKRGGLLYGTVEEGGAVKVDFVYEPPQEATPLSLSLTRGSEEEKQVDFLAGLLGLKKVGWLFAQSTAERDWIMSAEEVVQMARVQDEVGEQCATVVVSQDQQDGHVVFEAFQCSEQAVRLVREGWLLPEDSSSPAKIKVVNPKEPDVNEAAIVAGKDASEVDTDWFLCPLAILQHDGPLLTSFAVENRLLPQGKVELREHLRQHSSKPYVERLSDLHLLLWLCKHMDTSDMLLLCRAVAERQPIMDGYKMLIDHIAGIQS